MGNRMIRHPRNVWVVRILAVLVILSTLEVDSSYVQKHMPHRGSIWAENWIAENGLDLPFVDLVDFPVLMAENLTEDDEVTPDLKTTVIRKSNSIENTSQKVDVPDIYASNQTDVSITREEERMYLLAMVQDLKLNNPDVFETSIIAREKSQEEYESDLQKAYAQSATIDAFEMDKMNKPVSWMAQGAVGPQYSSGMIGQPSGEAYAGASNIDNLVAQQQGVGQSISNQAFTAMLNVGVTLGSQFELLSGVNFTQMDGSHDTYYDSQVEKTQTIFTSTADGNNNGNKSVETVQEQVTYTNYFSDTLRANYRISSFEIPLVLRYNFGKQKVNYFLSSGISTNIGNYYSASYQSGEIGTGNINEVGYGVQAVNLLLGIGIQYKASQNISIQLSPGYKYGIPVAHRIYQTPVSSLGLFTGLNYYF
ncbi:hypothetical protein KFE94_15860 [bacterium SCSIO 12643]|nr:hypothetical protein KFE94_15860 [bacterium SCSIO 12643]